MLRNLANPTNGYAHFNVSTYLTTDWLDEFAIPKICIIHDVVNSDFIRKGFTAQLLLPCNLFLATFVLNVTVVNKQIIMYHKIIYLPSFIKFASLDWAGIFLASFSMFQICNSILSYCDVIWPRNSGSFLHYESNQPNHVV